MTSFWLVKSNENMLNLTTVHWIPNTLKYGSTYKWIYICFVLSFDEDDGGGDGDDDSGHDDCCK